MGLGCVHSCLCGAVLARLFTAAAGPGGSLEEAASQHSGLTQLPEAESRGLWHPSLPHKGSAVPSGTYPREECDKP